MSDELRYKKLERQKRVFYNALVRDVIVATIRRDSSGWWVAWSSYYGRPVKHTAEEHQQILDAVEKLNNGEEL